MLTWKDFEKAASRTGLVGGKGDLDGAEEFIARLVVGDYRPKHPEKIASIYPLSYFKEALNEFFEDLVDNVLKVLHWAGREMKDSNDELFVQMIFLKHESLTLANAVLKLKSDAQLFDIWQKLESLEKRITTCLEMTPGSTLIETDNGTFYMIEGEAPSWSLWAEDMGDIGSHYDGIFSNRV